MSGDLLGKVCSLGFKRGTKLGPDAEEFDLRGLRPVNVVGWAPPPQLRVPTQRPAPAAACSQRTGGKSASRRLVTRGVGYAPKGLVGGP